MAKARMPSNRLSCTGLIAFVLIVGTLAGPARAQDASCIPKGDKEPTYLWDRLNIVRHPGGGEMPTATSLDKQLRNQTGQIALDTARNRRLAFISGVTLEAPADSDDWTVVQTATCPPARWAGALVFDPVHGEFLLWGGTLSIDGPTNDLWIYSPEAGDWRRLDYGSAEMRDLNGQVEAAHAGLETLRWNLWKRLEWTATGREGAPEESALISAAQEVGAQIDAAATLAEELAPTLEGHERKQAEGAVKWLAATAPKVTAARRGIEGRTPEALETGYRALMSARADLLRAVDAVRLAPSSRYFISLTYDEAQRGFTLDSTTENKFTDNWVFRVDSRRWERLSPAPGEAAPPAEPQGEFVLRDAASLAELRQWQAETRAWAEDLPPNTWVRAPAHGTGKPNWGRVWSSILYDPDRRQLYYRDGGHGSYHGNVTDHYDIPTGRWFRSDVEQIPDSRIMGTYFGWGRGYNYAPWSIHTYKWSLFYNPLTGHMQRRVFHTPNYPVGGNLNDYDPDQGKWSKQPATVNIVGTVVQGVPDGIVSVHGWERYGSVPSATVAYQTADDFKKWTNTGPIPFHGANNDDDYAFVYDPPRRRIMYYGGDEGTLALMALGLDAAKPRWEKLPATTADGARLPAAYREWIYIPKHDVFLTMQWQPLGSTKAPIVWSFDPSANQFRRVELALGNGVVPGGKKGNLRSASVSAGLAYDPVSDVAFYIHSENGPPVMFAFRYVPG
jgi:hypothetical protein